MKYLPFFVIAMMAFGFSAGEAQAKVYNQTEIERAVTRFFKDTPEMIAIAKCESEFRQYTDSGNTLRGGLNGKMIGVYQVNEVFHRPTAESLGLDIDTLMGNLLYAKHLLATQGLTPWFASEHCWSLTKDHYRNVVNNTFGTNVAYAAEPDDDEEEEEDEDERTPSVRNDDDDREGLPSSKLRGEFTKRLEFEDVHPQARLLQQVLNRAGYTVADYGPGSPGRETDKFGFLTFKALVAFQCDNDITCPTKRNIEDYGVLTKRTRDALNDLLD